MEEESVAMGLRDVEPVPVFRDGQSVVQVRHNGQALFELNFTKIVGDLFSRLGVFQGARR